MLCDRSHIKKTKTNAGQSSKKILKIIPKIDVGGTQTKGPEAKKLTKMH